MQRDATLDADEYTISNPVQGTARKQTVKTGASRVAGCRFNFSTGCVHSPCRFGLVGLVRRVLFASGPG